MLRQVLLIFGVMVLTVALMVCGRQPDGTNVPTLRVVETIQLEEPERPTPRQFPGEVRADQRAELAFLVFGPLMDLPVQEGQTVSAGDLLGRIDPREFRNDRDARRSDRDEARSNFDRISRAFETQSVTAAERDQSRARLQVAEAELALAQKRLDDTELRAPFAGRVARRFVENFQTVQVGQPIVLIEAIDRLEVRIQLPEQDVVRLPAGKSLLGAEVGTVSFAALPDLRFPVTVKELEMRADARTNTYRVVFSLPRPEQANILPGMSASFSPHEQVVERRSAHRLPVAAVQATADRRSFVWVLAPEPMTVQRRFVTLGGLRGTMVEVLDGLTPGEQVVTAGAAYLVDGEAVRVRN